MRRWIGGLLAIGVLGAVMGFGCGGDDETSSGAGQGGGSDTAGPTSGPGPGSGGATHSSSSTTSTTSAGGAGGSGAQGGSGGGSGCTEITPGELKLLFSQGPFAYGGSVMPALGGADPDAVQLEIYDETVTGVVDLAGAMEANYATCNTCLRVFEDSDMDGMPAKQYFQASGMIDYGATTPAFIVGTVTDAKLVEVTIDPDTFDSKPVPNGGCLHITSAPFNIVAPPAAWTCPPENYNDGLGCDCTCGAADPDCANAALPTSCLDGQTCAADGSACEGVPTAWTCPADQYGGGAGNGCDCNCGTHDPDCDIMNEPVDGCAAGESCTPAGLCLPAAWTCMADFYSDGLCDCGCGVLDLDCADALVGTCEYCDDTGSCSATACPGTINGTNNAICN